MIEVVDFCNHEVQCWGDGSVDLMFCIFDEPIQEVPMYYISLHHDFVTNHVLHLHIFTLGSWFL